MKKYIGTKTIRTEPTKMANGDTYGYNYGQIGAYTIGYTTSNGEGGWSNDFDDPTICRFTILKTDTIKQNKQ